MKSNRKYLFLLLLGTAFWGISVPLAKEGISVVSPFIFLMYRFLVATIVLSAFFYKRLINIDSRTIKYGLIVSVPLIVALSLQTVCLKYTTSSNTAFIAGMDVLLVPLLKLLFFKKKIGNKTWIACCIALLGLSVIAISPGLRFNLGDLIALVGAISFGIYIVMVGRLSYQKYDIASSVVIQMVACTVYCLVISVVIYPIPSLVLPDDISLWKSILFAGILGTAYMYCIQNIAQKYIEDEKIALTYLCEPIFATVAAYFLIGEAITLKTLVGGGLIILALFIAEYKFKRISVLKESL